MSRDPYDGEPYYCVTCGVGYPEFMACEEPDACKLESREKAQARKRKRRDVGSDAKAHSAQAAAKED